MYLSWVLRGCAETGAIWITPAVTQRETTRALHCPPVLANVAAGTAFQVLRDTHAEVSYSCSCQLIEATQGNQKPCKEWTHRGGAEIFYKARRNVPGGNKDREEKHCKVAFCWYSEHLSEVTIEYSIYSVKTRSIFRIWRWFTLYLLALASFKIGSLLTFADDVIPNLWELLRWDQDLRTVGLAMSMYISPERGREGGRGGVARCAQKKWSNST